MVLGKFLLFLYNNSQGLLKTGTEHINVCMGHTDHMEGLRLTEERLLSYLSLLQPPAENPLHKPGLLRDKQTSATIPDISFMGFPLQGLHLENNNTCHTNRHEVLKVV